MNKVVEKTYVKKYFSDGMTLMIGGFMGCGTPEKLIDLVIELGIKDLTLICTDTATPDIGIGRLIKNRCVKKLYASHIGLNPETGKQMNEGSLQVELIPQGNLAEKIRCGGYGLGGVLTPTGIGTLVENGKETFNVDGIEYILEKPLKADVSLIRGSVVDTYGNTVYKGTTNNFNQVMATAANIVIIEAEKIVTSGELCIEMIMTPSTYIDYIIDGGNNNATE